MLALYLNQFFAIIFCLSCILSLLLFSTKHFKKYYKEYIKINFAFLIGFFWCIYQSTGIVKNLPSQYIGKKVRVTGLIDSIPRVKKNSMRFEYLIDSIDQIARKPVRVLMFHYSYTQNFPPIRVGERWELEVRLKQPRGFWNPGSFDYEAWLLQHRIQWTGTLVPIDKFSENKHKKLNTLVKGKAKSIKIKKLYQWSINKIQIARSKIETGISAVLHQEQDKFLTGLIEALVTGKRENILEESWATMRATGTNHLFSISGLHIGLIGGMFYRLTSLLWKICLPLSLSIPSTQASCLVAWLGALGYSLLSGMALPVQRAIIMMSVFTFAYVRREYFSIWKNWSTALLVMLVYDPLIVLSESFWLSFSAVSIIFYGTGGRLYIKHPLNRLRRFWEQWGRTQWIVSFGLAPITILFFRQIAFLSFFVNLIAIPWVGCFVLPFCMSGALVYLVWQKLGSLLIFTGAKSLSILWKVLVQIENLSIAQGFLSIDNVWVFLNTMLGVLLLLSPKKFPGRPYLGVIFFFPIFLTKSPAPKEAEFWITLLDVGQGLSAVIRTKNHVLVYDTGPKLGMFSDTGKTVLLPYLRFLKIRHIHTLVISHGDNDHSGGLHSVLKGSHVHSLLSSQPERLHSPLAKPCYNGQQWVWDGVKFEVLHPSLNSKTLTNNDNSCVLYVTNQVHSVLLPGDIHRKGEKILLKNHPDLKSTVLISPHHGSKTSSSVAFVKTVQPRYLLFPVGAHNRFGFPHASVVLRYIQQNCKIYSTAQKGAITLKLGNKKNDISLENYYDTQGRFWHQTPDEIIGVSPKRKSHSKTKKYQHTKKSCQ